MKKYLSLMVTVIACIVFIGCSAPIQLAADLMGNMAASSLKSNNTLSSSNLPQPELIIGQETERYRVGNYDIGISDGFYKNGPSINFSAYDDRGRRTKVVYFEKKIPDDMKMINDFNQMSNAAKKQQIRTWFIQYTKLDLGPIEPETVKQEIVSTPPAAPSLPTPGFAPNPKLR